MSTFSRFRQEFRKSERGMVLPLVALIFFVLVMSAGVAVDYGRAQLVQSKLQAALDAAGLAAASVAKSHPDVQTQVNMFMEANFPQGYMGATGAGSSFVTLAEGVAGENGSITINLEARANVETLFMGVFGRDSVPVAAASMVNLARARGMELVLVLDNSGSMGTAAGGQTRMQALKGAVTDLFDQLFADQDSYDNMFAAIVPFTNQVRIGDAKATSSYWMRENAASTVAIDTPITCAGTTTHCCIDERAEQRPLQYSRTDQQPVNGNPNTLFNREALRSCNIARVTPLLRSRAQILNAVNAMNANGNTRIDVGAVWGWRLLSPNWSGLWAHSDASLPLSYNMPDMDKVIVILTDGRNEPISGTVTAAEANSNLAAICQNMKAQNIIVYTITLHLDNATTQNLMRNCATSPSDHYFHVAPNGRLDSVFRRIAESLMNLRISR